MCFQVFDQYGSFLSYVNTSGCKLYGPQVRIYSSLFGENSHNFPVSQGLALTKEGNIVVADSGNHCVKLYRYLQ